MASSDLRKELECSVCLSLYTDPVTLTCGHNFCRVCMDRVLDTQEGSGGYSCPQCRRVFQERPELRRNITLHNVVENILSTDPGEIGIFCTYCTDSPVPAVKSCLHCEASLCDGHLKVHSNSPEHVLTNPNRKCSEHKKILKYYCTEDAACVCVSCYANGQHRGHKLESIDQAYDKKKLELRKVLQKMTTMREKTEGRVKSQQEHSKKVEKKAASEIKRVTAMLRDLTRQLEELEKSVLREISQQAELASRLDSDLIQQLEIKKAEITRKMNRIEELCDLTDPLTVLQEQDTGDLWDTEEDGETRETLLPGAGDLDVAGISGLLHIGLSNIFRVVNGSVHPADILLDVDTAHNLLLISDDAKTASWSDKYLKRPQTPARFQSSCQVLSRQSFYSGCHYWEVDVGGSDHWGVGVSYPSIDRKRASQSLIGNNNKSWCLKVWNHEYKMVHDGKIIQLPINISSSRVRIYLDYDEGWISFFDLCDPVRHLHTFTTTFTEPLHVALSVPFGCIRIT